MPHLQPARFLQFWHLRSNLFYLCFQIYIVVFRCSTTDPTQLKQSSDQCIAGILRKINTDVSSTCVYLTHNLQSLCHYRRSLCILRFCSLLFTVWLRRGRLILRFHNAHMIWQGFLGANLARWIMRQHNLDLDTQYTWNIDNIPVIQLFKHSQYTEMRDQDSGSESESMKRKHWSWKLTRKKSKRKRFQSSWKD